MSINGFIDNYAMSIGALVARKHKYFSKGVESKNIIDVANSLNIDMPNIKGSGYYPFFMELQKVLMILVLKGFWQKIRMKSKRILLLFRHPLIKIIKHS